MITCPNCKTDIEAVQNCCPKCGIEIYYCLRCRITARGRRCIICGSATVSTADRASLMAMRPSQRFFEPRERPAAAAQETGAGTMRPQQGAAHARAARLVATKDPAMELPLSDGATIGRTHGEYTAVLGRMSYISGHHARIDYDPDDDTWTITDLKSTNGTRVNGVRLQPLQPAAFHVGDTITLAYTDFRVQPAAPEI